MPKKPRQGTVLYLLEFLPTYVRAELEELQRRGQPVAVVLPTDSPRASMWEALAQEGAGNRGNPDLLASLPWPLPRLGQEGFRTRLRRLAGPLARTLSNLGVVRIHAHFAKEAALLGCLLAEELGIPFSVTTHANDIFVPRDVRSLEEILEKATPTFTISSFNQSFLESRFGNRLTRRLRVTHLGVDLSSLPSPPPVSPTGRNLVCAASGLVQKKGIPVLLGACRILRDRKVDFRCTVFGADPSGTELRRLRGEVSALALEPHVSLPGAVPSSLLLDAVAEASIFVLPCVRAPNGDMDGIPVSLMEAMALGTPVLSTPISGIPELVTDGRDGLLVAEGSAEELANGIEDLLDHPDKRTRMGLEARATVEARFTIQDHVDRMVYGWDASAPGSSQEWGPGPDRTRG